MHYILRRHEIVVDDWTHLGEEITAGAAVIVPLDELHAESSRWRAWPGPLGVRLSPTDRVEDLVDELPLLRLIAVEFPTVSDGRGYSQGHLLRTRFGFRGELRALGAGVRQDQVFLLARCGFDAMELAPGEDLHAARRALNRYSVAYQPGAPGVALARQRFFGPPLA